jgi:homoserine kinase type II
MTAGDFHPPSQTISHPSGSVGTGSTTSGLGGAGARDQFAADELAIVLSHYDLGTIESIQPFPRGSRRAPKLVLRSKTGTYILKRRARGKDDPFRVAFSHELQLYLASKQFPLPHLIGTKEDNNSMLQWNGRTYELFEFIRGTSFDNSLEATSDAGRILALFHKLLVDYHSRYDAPTGSYHAARNITVTMEAIPQTLNKVDPRHAEEQSNQIQNTIQFLQSSYNEAAARVNELGLVEWPMQIVHCDWHPGNMLFRGPKVVAVIDYDAARLQQRVIDVANGALQFSIIGGGDDASHWPDHLDETHFQSFLRGYETVPNSVLSRAELRTLPWLMIEALVAESVIPIAATGSFARMEGVGFLMMIERKVRWLQAHVDQLSRVMESAA